MAAKARPTPPLSSLQRKQLLGISLVIALLLVVWLLVAPGRGVYRIQQQEKYLASLRAEESRLTQQNKGIRKEMERLNGDRRYLEQVARGQHGMLKENETVFDFNPEKGK